jgi:hypothetical protein
VRVREPQWARGVGGLGRGVSSGGARSQPRFWPAVRTRPGRHAISLAHSCGLFTSAARHAPMRRPRVLATIRESPNTSSPTHFISPTTPLRQPRRPPLPPPPPALGSGGGKEPWTWRGSTGGLARRSMGPRPLPPARTTCRRTSWSGFGRWVGARVRTDEYGAC